MQRNRFLADMLSTLFDRGDRLRGRTDARDIFDLCRALLSTEGVISGQTLAATIFDRYHAMSDAEKAMFFTFLNDELDINTDTLTECVSRYAADRSPQAFADLSQAAEPRRQELLRRLNQPLGATADIVAMRVDLLRILKQTPALARTDLDFVHLLRSWFNRGFLVLKTIDWDTPARILDKIVAYEAVHQIHDLDDLRRRLYPQDRRCFAFFHPAMPNEPLIFVEVALTAEIPGSVADLLSDGRTSLDPVEAKVAVFYSISNCQKGLSGISFGSQLIKQVVAELSLALPGVQKFVTLSPIPGLNRWLASQTEDAEHGHVAKAILDFGATPQDVRAMAARYLLMAKRQGGLPLDPVERFHLGNGAQIHDIHAGADPSENGMAQSSGAMVNYLYDLSQSHERHEAFALRAEIAAAKPVHTLSTAPLSAVPLETLS